jgi:predicted transcriptional regulator
MAAPSYILGKRMFNFDPIRLASFKYRDRVTIFRDVLTTIKRVEEGRKYTIMRKASLSYDQLNKYLFFLTNMGYIKEIAQADGRKYEVTEKGSIFLKSLEDLRMHIQTK